MVTVLAIEQVLRAVEQGLAGLAAESGLRGKDWQILAWLSERGPSSGGELAVLTCRRRQELHRSLKALERDLLVARVDTGSRSRVLWQLTEDGDLKMIHLKQTSFPLELLIRTEFGVELPKLIDWLERLRDVIRKGRVTQRGHGFSLSPPDRFFNWHLGDR